MILFRRKVHPLSRIVAAAVARSGRVAPLAAPVLAALLWAGVPFAAAAASPDVQAARAAAERGDFTAALSQIAPLAEAGNADAQYELAVLHVNGDGTERNYDEAAKWFRLAATKGHAQAKSGLAFLESAGVLKPPAKAPAPVAEAPTGDGPRALVQVATVASESSGTAEWRRQQRLYPDLLGSLSPTVQAYESGDKTMYRVMGGPLTLDSARSICDALRGAGGTCRVSKTGG